MAEEKKKRRGEGSARKPHRRPKSRGITTWESSKKRGEVGWVRKKREWRMEDGAKSAKRRTEVCAIIDWRTKFRSVRPGYPGSGLLLNSALL